MRRGLAYRKELEEQPISPIAEFKLEDTIGPDLRHRGDSPRLQTFSKPGNKGRRCGSGGPAKFGQMAAEASVDDELLLVVGLGELKQEDLGREVVDVGDSQGGQALLELMGNDLRELVSRASTSLISGWKELP